MISNGRRLAHVLALALMGSATACVVSPKDKGTVPHAYHQFTVSGFGTKPSAPITVEALNQRTGAWETIGTTKTAEEAGVLGGKRVYGYDVKVAVATSAETLCRWASSCKSEEGSSARIRVRQGEKDLLYGADNKGFECFAKVHEKSPGEDPALIGRLCGFGTTITIRIERPLH